MQRFLFSSMCFVSFSLVSLSLTGCGGETNNPQKADVSKVEKKGEHHEGDGHDHAHPTVGPHKGHLIELGAEEYHAELVHDDATKTVSVYLLDSKAEKPVAIEAKEIPLNLIVNGKPKQALLASKPQVGDEAERASLFVVTDEAVLEALEAPTTTGRISVTIAGKTYTGTLEHHEHDEAKK